MRTAHGQRTSASCAVFPCAFIRRGRGVNAHPCIPLPIPLPECTFATALAAITIPPAPARAGGVQKTATKAQFNRNDKCPKLCPKPDLNTGLFCAFQTPCTLRQCLLHGTPLARFCYLLFIDLLITLLSALRWEFYTLRFTRRRVHLSWCTHHMKARMPMNVIVSCRIRRDLP